MTVTETPESPKPALRVVAEGETPTPHPEASALARPLHPAMQAVADLIKEREELKAELDSRIEMDGNLVEAYFRIEHLEIKVEEANQAARDLVAVLKEGHRSANHRGPWDLCEDGVCSFLEEWAHRRFGDTLRIFVA